MAMVNLEKRRENLLLGLRDFKKSGGAGKRAFGRACLQCPFRDTGACEFVRNYDDNPAGRLMAAIIRAEGIFKNTVARFRGVLNNNFVVPCQVAIKGVRATKKYLANSTKPATAKNEAPYFDRMMAAAGEKPDRE